MDLSNIKFNPTEDIELRFPSVEELEKLSNEVFKPENHERILKYTGFEAGANTPKKYLELNLIPRLEKVRQGSKIFLLIFYKGKIAGRISAHDIDYRNQKTELGYFLLKEFEEKGIMSACVKSLEDFIFDALKFNRIELSIAPNNDASVSLAKKLGYKYEGILRQSYFNAYTGELEDDMVFAKLKHDIINLQV